MVGVALVAFGFGCFNYTKPSTIQHHQEWAAEKGMPAPSDNVLRGGMGSAALGAFVIGFSLRRRGTAP